MKLLTAILIVSASSVFACSSSSGGSGATGGSTGTGGSADDSGAGAGGTVSGTSDASDAPTAVIPPDADVTEKTIAPTDAHIRYSGRIDMANAGGPRFSGSAVSISLKFQGVGVSVGLRDEFRGGTSGNYFDAWIDDGPPIKLKMQPSSVMLTYPIASNLAYGEHTVKIGKRTEGDTGMSTFLGFKVQGTVLDPPAAPARKMEIIGDSITAGAGMEAVNGSAQCSEDGYGQPYENGNLAYGPVLARRLSAEYHVQGVSGIGLYRNYFNRDARTMPQVYDSLFTEETASPAYDETQFVPDAVIIGLGTNDFSTNAAVGTREKLDVAAFTQAYVDFVTKLRGLYPNAHIFCTSSSLLGDGYPTAADHFFTDLQTVVATVAQQLNTAGDANVHSFAYTKVNGTGCGSHPGVPQQASMAQELGDYVAMVMSW
ncbi:MAG TPA: SGNH/GDSL hydrolase family protein [Polyangiaceae bacterium]